MLRPAYLAVLLVLTGLILGASLFVCQEVHNYEQMADVRVGFPVAFVSVNMRRYTPLEFPQCFEVGSPWEDPMRVLWPAFLLNVAIVFGLLLAISLAFEQRLRTPMFYWARWFVLIPAVIAAFAIAGICAALIADQLGLWYEPAAGFGAAASVVLVAYMAAPDFKIASATAALLIGAIAAWVLIAPPSLYIDPLGVEAEQPTYLPVMITYAGGVVSWVGCIIATRILGRDA